MLYKVYKFKFVSKFYNPDNEKALKNEEQNSLVAQRWMLRLHPPKSCFKILYQVNSELVDEVQSNSALQSKKVSAIAYYQYMDFFTVIKH